MKNIECKQFNTLMVDALYGELQRKDKGVFDSHLETCASCRAEYNRLSAALKVMDYREHPEPGKDYWDNFLPQLQEKIEGNRNVTAESHVNRFKIAWDKIRSQFSIRWVLYPVAAVFLVVAGIVGARYLYPPEPGEFTQTTVASVSPEVSEHFENLQPLLVDYSNFTPEQGNKDEANMVWVDRSELENLIIKNQLLKKAVERQNNPSLKLLLEDLEMILTEMSNSKEGKGRTDAIEAVQSILKENDVLFKMKVYEKNARKPANSI